MDAGSSPAHGPFIFLHGLNGEVAPVIAPFWARCRFESGCKNLIGLYPIGVFSVDFMGFIPDRVQFPFFLSRGTLAVECSGSYPDSPVAATGPATNFMRASQLLAPPMPGAICNSARTGTHRPDAGLESQGTFHFRHGSYDGVEWAFAVSPGLSECSLKGGSRHRTRDNVTRRPREVLVRPRYYRQFSCPMDLS